MTKRTTMKTMNKIVKIVREKGVLDMPDFVILCDLSPSTFYNYRGLITRLFPDIIYEEGRYKAIETDPLKELQISN